MRGRWSLRDEGEQRCAKWLALTVESVKDEPGRKGRPCTGLVTIAALQLLLRLPSAARVTLATNSNRGPLQTPW